MELCTGDRKDQANPWHWETVRLNLPCDKDYNPSFPRCMLLRADGELANRWVKYVDDIRVAVRGLACARRVCRSTKALMNSFGNQADDRKYRDVSLTLEG